MLPLSIPGTFARRREGFCCTGLFVFLHPEERNSP
jgi:hypothetical protein